MDHSIRGYLSRRSKKELEQIILMYTPLQDQEFYKPILELARHFLEKRLKEDQKGP